MEFDLIPQIIIIGASGVVIAILGRNIPKLKGDAGGGFWSGNYDEVEKREKEKFQFLFDRLKKKITKEEYKKKVDLFWIWFEKFVRKIRISFLKIDNTMVVLLEKLREKNIEKIERIFKDAKQKRKIVPSMQKRSAWNKDENTKENKFDWNKINKYANPTIQIERKKIIKEAMNDLAIKENSSENNEYSGKKPEDAATPTFQYEEQPAPGFEKAVKTEIKKFKSDNNAESLESEEKTSEEKECINMILKNPLDIKAYWQLGTIYARRRNYKDAVECFRQITKIDPTYDGAKNMLSEILEKMKKGVKRDKRSDSEKDISGNNEKNHE